DFAESQYLHLHRTPDISGRSVAGVYPTDIECYSSDPFIRTRKASCDLVASERKPGSVGHGLAIERDFVLPLHRLGGFAGIFDSFTRELNLSPDQERAE